MIFKSENVVQKAPGKGIAPSKVGGALRGLEICLKRWRCLARGGQR